MNDTLYGMQTGKLPDEMGDWIVNDITGLTGLGEKGVRGELLFVVI
jgi:hypothetical protein